MAEEPFDSERPPNETWWERELHRNEKLMDKYMAVLGDNPDWDKWKNPEDLYNKVHFGIDPPERTEESGETEGAEQFEAEDEHEEKFLEQPNITGEQREAEDADDWNEDDDPFDDEPGDNEDYPTISKQARRFACRVFDLKHLPNNAELLYLSAGKVGANLAGGHGLGYDDETICGNIVKCRWALSDCEFCREMLEQVHKQTGDATYAALVDESRQLAATIRERIARLRARVWW